MVVGVVEQSPCRLDLTSSSIHSAHRFVNKGFPSPPEHHLLNNVSCFGYSMLFPVKGGELDLKTTRTIPVNALDHPKGSCPFISLAFLDQTRPGMSKPFHTR